VLSNKDDEFVCVKTVSVKHPFIRRDRDLTFLFSKKKILEDTKTTDDEWAFCKEIFPDFFEPAMGSSPEDSYYISTCFLVLHTKRKARKWPCSSAIAIKGKVIQHLLNNLKINRAKNFEEDE
jgi:hypothetical protein